MAGGGGWEPVLRLAWAVHDFWSLCAETWLPLGRASAWVPLAGPGALGPCRLWSIGASGATMPGTIPQRRRMLCDSPKPFVLPHMSLTTVPKGMHHLLALHLPEDELEVQNGSSKIAQLVCARAGAPLCIPLKASPVLFLGL